VETRQRKGGPKQKKALKVTMVRNLNSLLTRRKKRCFDDSKKATFASELKEAVSSQKREEENNSRKIELGGAKRGPQHCGRDETRGIGSDNGKRMVWRAGEKERPLQLWVKKSNSEEVLYRLREPPPGKGRYF